jgi:hypothetical protein
MKVGFGPLLLTLSALAALAACARGTSPQGAASSPGTAAPVTSTAVASASANSDCPTETVLDPGPDAKTGATAAAVAAVPRRYPPTIDTTGFQVTNAYAADPSSGYGAIAYGLCGAAVGQRTWVVELLFPKMAPSVSLAGGQLFVSRFADGWRVWFQYH